MHIFERLQNVFRFKFQIILYHSIKYLLLQNLDTYIILLIINLLYKHKLHKLVF